MKFTLYSRRDSYSDELCETIEQILNQNMNLEKDDEHPDLIICVGGDGTILRAIHHFIDILDTAVFVGIHTGTLGFFTDYTKEEFIDFIQDVETKPYCVDSSNLLEIYADHSDQIFYALNEFRLGSFLKTVEYDVYIDSEFFEHTTGSGICISTQAGSTAVNRALGGAVVDDGLEVLQLAEITPISHKNHRSLKNPYIMRSDRTLTIYGPSITESEACYDFKSMDVTTAKMITIRMSDKQVRFARFKPYSYLKRLRNLY